MSKKKPGKRKSKARKGSKRSKAAKRAYKKSGLYKYNLKRKSKGGKKRKSYGKKRSGKAKRYVKAKNKYSGSAVAARARFNNLVKRLEGKGYDEKTATALAHRAVRMGKAMGRGKAKHVAGVAAQQQAMANLFGGIAAAGQLEAMRR